MTFQQIDIIFLILSLFKVTTLNVLIKILAVSIHMELIPVFEPMNIIFLIFKWALDEECLTRIIQV